MKSKGKKSDLKIFVTSNIIKTRKKAKCVPYHLEKWLEYEMVRDTQNNTIFILSLCRSRYLNHKKNLYLHLYLKSKTKENGFYKHKIVCLIDYCPFAFCRLYALCVWKCVCVSKSTGCCYKTNIICIIKVKNMGKHGNQILKESNFKRIWVFHVMKCGWNVWGFTFVCVMPVVK